MVWLVVIMGCTPALPPESVPGGSADGLVVIPATGARGTTVVLHLEAPGGWFAEGTTVDLGPDVVVGTVVVEDADSISVEVTLSEEAEEGLRDVTIGRGGRDATAPGAFTVTSTTLTVSPATWPAGEVGFVALTGSGTAWTQDGTWPELSDPLRIVEWTVLSETSATARIGAAPDAEPGWYGIIVHGDAGGPSSAALAITPREVSAQMVPAEVTQGEEISFVLEGERVELDDASLEIVGSDAARGLDLRAPDVYPGILEAAWEAAPGPRDVVLTDENGREVWMPGAFEVIDAPRPIEDLRLELTFDITRDLRSDGSHDEVVTARADFAYLNRCRLESPNPMPRPYDDPGVYPRAADVENTRCAPTETADAGAQVRFVSDSQMITLDRAFTDDSIGYRADVSLGDYAFGELYTFEVTGSEVIPAFLLEDAQPTVPADFTVEPFPETWPRTKDFVVRWTPAQTAPDAYLLVKIDGFAFQTNAPVYVGVIPTDDGEFTLPAALLGELAPGNVTLTVTSWTQGPHVTPPWMPWDVRFDSTLTWRASIDLQ